jgi:methylmalonyl-CoA mutase N-terminal domain/subunit
VLGGTQSLHTNARDEALSLPTVESARLALRTQQILAYETGVAATVDPLAGSYYVEALTDRLEREAQAYLDEIDRQGGAVAAIEAGYVQREIQDAAYRHQRLLERGDLKMVGVNVFQEDDAPPPVEPVDPQLEASQRQRVQQVRRRRDGAAVEAALRQLAEAARGDGNLMPPLLEAVRRYATIGEMVKTLEAAFGRYVPPQVL